MQRHYILKLEFFQAFIIEDTMGRQGKYDEPLSFSFLYLHYCAKAMIWKDGYGMGNDDTKALRRFAAC
jgi:hypothetical protein